MRTGKTPAGLSPQAPELKLPKLVLGAVMAFAKALYGQTGWAALLKSGKRKQCVSAGIYANMPCIPFVFPAYARSRKNGAYLKMRSCLFNAVCH